MQGIEIDSLLKQEDKEGSQLRPIRGLGQGGPTLVISQLPVCEQLEHSIA